MLCMPVEPLELLDQIHGRSLLGKKGDPAKSAWEPKTNRKSATVFVQVRSIRTFLYRIRDQLFWACDTFVVQRVQCSILHELASAQLRCNSMASCSCRAAACKVVDAYLTVSPCAAVHNPCD